MKRTLSITIVCLTAAATAQQSSHATTAQVTQPSLTIEDVATFRAPIHTQDADPIGGEYGTWASGQTYKVSFEDGLTFYPAIAKQDAHVRWQTTSVRVGNRELLSTDLVEREHSDWRYEYHYGEVTEAYDVRVDGVEQTFVFPTIPGQGDIVVTGRVSSPLEFQEMSPQHSSVEFANSDGESLVKYGAATVFDAAGRSLQITTAVAGQDIELRVPAAWLATATAPVTIDPLLSTTVVRNSSGNTIRVEMARDDESNQLLIAYGRWIGNNVDLFTILCNDDFSAATLVYSDVTASWESSDPAFGFVAGGDKWLMTFTRKFSSSSYGVRYRFHPKGLKQLQTNIKALASPSGKSARRSDVGGTAAFTTGSEALVVFEADTYTFSTGTAHTEVWGSIFDATTETAGPAFLLSSQGTSLAQNRDRGLPTVNLESDGNGTSWIACWQEYNLGITDDDWDIYATKVGTDGSVTIATNIGQLTKSRHSVRPRIAGRGGRYLLAFGESNNPGGKGEPTGGQNLFAQRFNWNENRPVATRLAMTSVRSVASVTYFPGNVAFDSDNESHWVIVSHGQAPNQVVFADVIGYAGGIVESLTVSPVVANTDFSPAVIYNDDTDDFAIAFGSTNHKVYGRMLTRNVAGTSTYGIACGPGSITSTGLPQSGSQFFKVTLVGTAPNTNA